MTKILVADDEVDLEMLIKQKFRKQIREQKYEFVFALNGTEALAKLEQHPDISILLSDINMPEMDGLSLLSKMAESNPLVKAVMVSAYGDMENIRTAMNRGAFDFVCKPVNFQDLELTIEKTLKHVNQIKKTLQAVKENSILRMYVDENVLNFMSTREFETSLLTNETLEVSVAFIDICSFTSISENEPANVVVHLLNTYFDEMVKEIIAQGGYIDKFIGDAIMAVFKGEFHLDRAVEACLGVRKQIDDMPAQGEHGNFLPKVSIGINSGEVISGNIGSETLRRLDYTIIGDVVNTAQRLQSVALPGQIVVNESCYEKIKQSFNCQKVGEVSFKNKAVSSVIYEVLN
ncbi:adenylate/guanylate cyclase domain-containing protein [Rufibacter tibetensis]|uniref:Guanylate cyclase n=1 Tax=Rufibacter tibetensis TaxID=512763 RepID=A0A0P0CTT7_9BACT|nr:adenylate/guanylate cyclase domain-containing protein [Rufibacter tibetensis]ALI98635.1 guanylate cyclase [Rufibacter tibetensis]